MKWQSSARSEMNHRKLVRKYSDTLLPQWKKQWIIEEDSNLDICQEVRSQSGKRSKSLGPHDGDGIVINEVVPSGDERLGYDPRSPTAAPYGWSSSLEGAMWSRYWHDARNWAYVRNYSCPVGAKIQQVELRKEEAVRNETDTSEHIGEPEYEPEAVDGDKSPAIYVKQLSLEERLEKIEQERGFDKSQYKRKGMNHSIKRR